MTFVMEVDTGVVTRLYEDTCGLWCRICRAIDVAFLSQAFIARHQEQGRGPSLKGLGVSSCLRNLNFARAFFRFSTSTVNLLHFSFKHGMCSHPLTRPMHLFNTDMATWHEKAHTLTLHWLICIIRVC